MEHYALTNYFVINSDYAVEFVPTGEPTTTERFATVENESDIAALPSTALVEIWNGFAGTPGFDDMKPVNRFENRTKAARRIWEKIQKLVPAAKPVETKPARFRLRFVADDAFTQPIDASKPERAACKAKPETKPVAEATEAAPKPERDTAKAKVLGMLREGTTLDAIMNATGWQRHTVRGFISGTVHKRMGLAVTAHTDEETKIRHYKIAGQA